MIKVMSFNIRMGLADDGINHWQYRKSLALSRINAFQPDLLGLQECWDDDSQAGFIRESLADYEFYGVQRGGDSGAALEMAPALFKKTSFELVDQGCFWLSETPEMVGSQHWDAAFPRTCLWFKLLHRATGKELVFLNTHFDYQPLAINESARVLQQWIVEHIGTQALIVTGDFNADKACPAYQTLTGQLGDARPDRYSTFHEFGKIKSGCPIDWILTSSHFVALNTKIDRYHKGGLYPSDHYPLTATLNWKY